MEQVTVPKEIETKVATIESDVLSFEEKAQALVIDSPEANTEATDILGVLTKRKKSIEEARKFFVDPLNQQVKAINAKFKPQTAQVDDVIKTIKGKVGAWHLAEEKRIAKEDARKQAVRDKANAKREEKGEAPIEAPVNTVAPKDQTTATENASATVKKVWTFKVKSYKELPDNVKVAIFDEAIKKGLADTVIRKMVTAGIHEMSGVEIYQDTQVAVR